jgi:Fe-S cluster biosynthesis and repair protein YggX
LDVPPLRGPWGAAIQAETCQECWHLWLDEQTRLINHEHLQPFVPADKAKIYARLREFLNLQTAPTP